MLYTLLVLSHIYIYINYYRYFIYSRCIFFSSEVNVFQHSAFFAASHSTGPGPGARLYTLLHHHSGDLRRVVVELFPWKHAGYLVKSGVYTMYML